MSAAMASPESISEAAPRLSLITRLVAALSAHYVTACAAREMESFDDRMLSDIGLTRGDIRGALFRAIR